MKFRKLPLLICLTIVLSSLANAQKTEVTISLNEQFFDALLDAIYLNSAPLEFPLARNEVNRRDAETQRDLKPEQFPSTELSSNFTSLKVLPISFSASQRLGGKNPPCNESIRLLRENNGVRTAVRFREGKILAPMAFSGSYSPPFIGCVNFSGYAETNIELQFDQDSQRLIARAKVLNVSLNGTAGIGGSVIARMVQGSIDKKINPIEIIQIDKLSFVAPIQNGAHLRMKATGVRHEISNGVLNIHVAYEFLKPDQK